MKGWHWAGLQARQYTLGGVVGGRHHGQCPAVPLKQLASHLHRWSSQPHLGTGPVRGSTFWDKGAVVRSTTADYIRHQAYVGLLDPLELPLVHPSGLPQVLEQLPEAHRDNDDPQVHIAQMVTWVSFPPGRI